MKKNIETIKNLEENFKKVINSLNIYGKIKLDDESLKNTPLRLARMYINELLIGYQQNPAEILSKQFDAINNDLVIVKNIPFVSLCSHHWLPFIGKIHIGYIPKDKKIVGLSKLPRLVKCYSSRFQIQENMTTEIADSLFDILKPAGCIVICKAQHLCAQIRGVQSYDTDMVTSSIRGSFSNIDVRNEFLDLLKTNE